MDEESIFEGLMNDLTDGTIIITVVDSKGSPIRVESTEDTPERVIATLVKAVIALGLEGIVRELADDDDESDPDQPL